MESDIIKSYRDLVVWQKSMDLVTKIYELTEQFPRSEIFVLTAQMRRCAISIPSNIAEGRRRGSRIEFRRFLIIAFGSGAELETQLEIAKRLSFGKNFDFSAIELLLNEIMKMLNKMIATLSK
ncbi:MAG: four helix bundle protein [Patescibacteria group bacterium]|nr:four helix bundle protein [Patescibacteria group bacterium]